MRSSKNIAFWSMAVRNVLRFRGRTLAILLPLFVVMACASVMTFIKDGICRDALRSVEALPDITIQQMVGGRIGPVHPELAAVISNYGNVLKVVPRVWGYVPLQAAGGNASYTLMGMDCSLLPSALDISPAIESGRFLKFGDKHCAVIGKVFAFQNKVKPGDKITLQDELGNKTSLNIIGIFNTPVQIYTADLIVTDIETARIFLGYLSDQSSDLAVYLKDPLYTDQVAESILISHKNIRVLTKEALAGNVRQGYGGKAGIFQLMWLILLLTVTLLAWTQASSISLEMKKEIGVLKALGWQTLDIIELKMMEIVIIGLTGILSGILFGIFYLHLGAPLVKQYFLGWAVLYPPFPLPISIEGSSIFLLFVIGLFPLCAATVFPAWRMGVVEPDTAIRGG